MNCTGAARVFRTATAMFSTAFLDLPPFVRAAGTVRLPGSKSISNRVLLLAGLCDGDTAVHDLLDSDDTRVMLAALEALGCGLRRDGEVLHVTGLGGRAEDAFGQPLPGQCRHGHAAADGGTGGAGRHARRPLRVVRRAAHA